jgi:hypothetical protein
MKVTAIRDYNRDADHAQDGDAAGEEPESRHGETPRPTLVDDVSALESEN